MTEENREISVCRRRSRWGCLLLLPFIGLILVLAVRLLCNPSEIPSVAGYFLLTVESGSMAPAIDTGDMILMKKTGYPDEEITAGKIIAFYMDGYIVTHRITRTEEQQGRTYFYTRGDANNTEDRNPVTAEEIVGAYIARIKGAGRIVWILQTPAGLAAFAGVFAAGWFVLEFVPARRHRK